MTTAKPMGTRPPAFAESLLSDEKAKLRAGQKCSPMVRPSALDGLRMAQEMASGQGFLEVGRETCQPR